MRQTPCEAHESNQTLLPAAEGQNLGPEKKKLKNQHLQNLAFWVLAYF